MIQVDYTNSNHWPEYKKKVNDLLAQLQNDGKKILSIRKFEKALTVEIVYADKDDDTTDYIGA